MQEKQLRSSIAHCERYFATPTINRVLPHIGDRARVTASSHSPITERFGKRLRGLRLRSAHTQKALADRLGIDRSYISDMELGKKSVSLSYLETIAQGFDLTLAELMNGI